jgi:hypothetical protein
MSNASNYYDMALLSEATYQDLKGIDLTSPNMDKDVQAALKDDDHGGEMTEKPVECFVAIWEVVRCTEL